MKLRKKMIEQIKLFLLVLSVLYCFGHLLGVIISLFQAEPTQIKVNVIEKVLLYLASTYVITSAIILLTT